MSTPENKRDFTDAAPVTSENFVPAKLWKDRKANEYPNPLAFIDEVYTSSLGQRPDRRVIRRNDMPLYNAYAKWAERHPSDDILPKAEILRWDDRMGNELDPWSDKFKARARDFEEKLSPREAHNFRCAVSRKRRQTALQPTDRVIK